MELDKQQEARRAAHEYYIQNKDRYRERNKKREEANPEGIKAYRAQYFQEVTKKRRHGEMALTPIRKQYSIRSDADHHTKHHIPKSKNEIQELGPRTLTFD